MSNTCSPAPSATPVSQIMIESAPQTGDELVDKWIADACLYLSKLQNGFDFMSQAYDVMKLENDTLMDANNKLMEILMEQRK